MISKTLAAPTLLAATVGVPYLASNAPEWTQQWRNGLASSVPADQTPGNATIGPFHSAQSTAAFTAPPQGPGASLYPSQTPLEGIPTYSIADVLRMDVTKEWVYQRWPRKSTALADLDLFGVRVPLVTGTQLHDLAGSLTYFFGIDGRVQRISFRGRTGDTTQLLTLLAQRDGFQAQYTQVAGEQLLQVRRGADVLSEVRTRPAPVLWASSPHDSFTVELELQDPATAWPLRGPTLPIPPQAAQYAANSPPPAAGASESPGSSPGDAAKEPAKQEKLGWKAFFPRSRLPKPQVKNLNNGNLYQ